MRHKQVAAALCAAVLMGLSAGAALAGEVKGPPTGGTSATNFNVAATSHANSICVFSGLNDYINGQVEKPTQTPADGPPGAPGHGIPGTPFADGCLGGSGSLRAGRSGRTLAPPTEAWARRGSRTVRRRRGSRRRSRRGRGAL